MAKIAVLATFTVTSRVIVEMPDEMAKKEYLESDECAESAAQKARNNILAFPSGYLVTENVSVEEDVEVPYGKLSIDKYE